MKTIINLRFLGASLLDEGLRRPPLELLFPMMFRPPTPLLLSPSTLLKSRRTLDEVAQEEVAEVTDCLLPDDINNLCCRRFSSALDLMLRRLSVGGESSLSLLLLLVSDS